MSKIYKKYNPSSAAFMWGSIVHTDYPSGCLRYILLNTRGLRDSINPKYMEMGAINEDHYEKRLKNAHPNIPYNREVVVRAPIGNTGIEYSGRIDFEIDPEDTHDSFGLVELKSTDSSNKRNTVIQNGGYVLNNLAQIVSYMIMRETVKGNLAYTFWKKVDGEWVQPEPYMYRKKRMLTERIFRVSISPSWRVMVDGKVTQWTVWDQVDHMINAARVIATGKVWERPANYDAVWGSPCNYCPFKGTCEKWDAGEIESEAAFVEEARKELQEIT